MLYVPGRLLGLWGDELLEGPHEEVFPVRGRRRRLLMPWGMGRHVVPWRPHALPICMLSLLLHFLSLTLALNWELSTLMLALALRLWLLLSTLVLTLALAAHRRCYAGAHCYAACWLACDLCCYHDLTCAVAMLDDHEITALDSLDMQCHLMSMKFQWHN